MVLIVRGPARPRPVMTGLLVGGAVARGRQNRRQQAHMQQEVQMANERAAQAQMQAELARKEAAEQRHRQEKQEQQMAKPVGEMVSVAVAIPQGVHGGQSFNISYEGQTFRVTCPHGMGPGQRLTIQVPAPRAAVALAEPVAAPVAEPVAQVALQTQGSGRDLFRSAMEDSAPPPPAAQASPDLVLTSDHLVDEAQMKQFGIISVSRGTTVRLVEGDLINGLGGAYKDYIRVSVPSQGNRVGLISRLIVKAKSTTAASAPPPALQ